MIVSTVIMSCDEDNLIVTFNSVTKLQTVNGIENLPKFRNRQCQLKIYMVLIKKGNIFFTCGIIVLIQKLL